MLKDKKLIKIIIISILAIIMVTVVFQNVAPIKLNFLFWTFTISRFLVVSLLLIIGFIFGWLLRGQFLLRKKEERFNAEGAEKNWRLWLKTKKKKQEAGFKANIEQGITNDEWRITNVDLRKKGKEQTMGDKGGKKDKAKSKKQITKKHEQKIKKSQDKQKK